ncbi:MAG: ABC transporter ATP-binding protein [Elusimicrobiales bacterium]
MSSDTAIRVSNISKCYHIYAQPQDRLKQAVYPKLQKLFGREPKNCFAEFWAARDISFEVKKGEVLGIIGRNGSGKSTILQMIAGTITPTAGEISVNGRVAALLELGAGFNPEFTGRENVYMNAALMGLSREETDARFDAIAKFADIGDFIERPVKTYSSGMYVRLAFAVAVHAEPDIFIVDEALSVGDIAFQNKCYRKFNEFREKGISILFVTHDLGTIIKYCDHVIVMEKGRQYACGDARAMADVYKQLLMPNENAAPAPDCADPADGAKNCFEKNPAFLEYGDKRAEITDWGIFDEQGRPAQIITDPRQKCEIFMRIRARESIPGLIAAFTIKDIKGAEVTGTNTWYRGDVIDVRAGETVEVRFRQNLPLQTGGYTLNFGCTSHVQEGLAVHHRLYDLLLLQASSHEQFVGVFNPASEIEIRRN